MDGNMELESYGNSIEGALCTYDEENENKLSDHDAIQIIESLIDIYHFKDQRTKEESPLVLNGIKYLDNVIKEDLNNLNEEVLVKILGVIRFVAKRRTKNGREYMNIIHQYVGQRIVSGIRLLSQ
jgi:antitoxin component HigA of HigAB toxin-antitoxin module